MAAPALAARAHEFTTTFGSKCLTEPGCTGEALFAPTAVAANESSGDVYVLDKGEGTVGARLVRFNKEGEFQSEVTGPNATGSGTLTEGSTTVTGVLKSTGVFTVGEELTATGLPAGTTITAVEGAGETLQLSAAATASELATLSAQQHFIKPAGVAVDNSCVLQKLTGAACETADPSNGDVYVADAGGEERSEIRRVVDKFSATGEFLGQITEAGPEKLNESELDGVAVDPSGMLWVYRERPEADGFTNGTTNEFTTKIELRKIGGADGFGVPGGFAVDSEGDFYGTLGTAFPPRAVKWDHAGKILIEKLNASESSPGVAVEQIGNDPAACEEATVGVFQPGGALVESLGAEAGSKQLTACAGVGVNATAGFIYATDSTGAVVAFGPAKPSTPKVEGESFSGVGSDRVSLSGTLNPRSEPGEKATEYNFQYGRCVTPTTCATSGYETTLPTGQVAAGFEVKPLTAAVTGLSPHTVYHFRLIARNSNGEGAPGSSVQFATEGAGGPLTLPDRRGWELVSPPDKLGALIAPISEFGVVQAAASGGALTYLASDPTEPQPQGYSNSVQVLSRRGAASWSTGDIAIPHSNATGFATGAGSEYKFFEPELSLSVVQPFGEFIPALSNDASESTAYLHDLGPSCGSSCFRPLVTGKPGVANVPPGTVFGEQELCRPQPDAEHAGAQCGPEFLGATEDLSHVVLGANAALTPGAVPLLGLYEWSAGTLAPVSVLPNKEPVGEAALGLENQAARQAISSDGNRIAWTWEQKSLYERDMALEKTVQLDAAQFPVGEGTPEKEARAHSSGGGDFQFASADGSRVLFTDFSPLTEDSGASEGHSDLYECLLVVEGGKLTCQLTDLTPKHGEEGADVLGGLRGGAILGASRDASLVYFVAKGVLTETANSRGQKALAGSPNLYLRRATGTEFITTLAGRGQTEGDGDAHDWNETLRQQPTRVSASGQWLEFMSEGSPTGYDNRDRASGEPVAEVYLYDATTKRLACASCEPTGDRPTGVEYLKLEPGSGGLAGGPRQTWLRSGLVAATVPGWTSIQSTIPIKARYQPRYLNDEGRLFFNSADALVPQDSNGTQDVYEHEPVGQGDCSEASATYSAVSEGCVSLISSGASELESAFMDASESGDDVFFLTSARLSALDTDNARDIYDAHVCSTGSPCITFPNTQSPPCTTEASCKPSPSPQPSIFGAPASSTFQGLGNPASVAGVKAKAKPPTRAQRLAAALKVCKRKPKKQRAGCQKQARKKDGPLPKARGKRGKKR